MKKTIALFVSMLAIVKTGSAAQQVSTVFLMSTVGVFMAGVYNFFNNYVFPDTFFGTTLVTLVILDTVFGAAKYIKQEKGDAWEMLKGFIFKLSVGLGSSMFAKTLLRMPEIIASEWATASIIYFLKVGIVIWIGMSFLGSVYILTNKKFPPSFMMNKLNKYSESGDVKELVTQSSPKQPPTPSSKKDDNFNEAL